MTHRNRRRLATVVLAPAAALVAWAIVRLLGIELEVSGDTGAVGAGDVVAAALAGAVAGWLVVLLVERRSRRPRSVWAFIASTALSLSIVGPSWLADGARRRLPPAAHAAAADDMIRVLIAEDQAMVRGALASLLALEDDIEVVGEVERGDAVLAAARARQPDVALLDIEMPGQDGIAAAAELARELPGTRTLILTTFGRPGYLRRAIESGAGGFLLKDAPAGQLADAVREVYAGRRVIDPGLAAAALADGVSPLTDREHDVLVAATRHATAAEIAAQLHLSEGTVRNSLSAAIRKLGARNRVEAMHIAEEKGWI